MVLGAVLAGGSGTRMGGKLPKQFLSVCGKPVLIHTLDSFYRCDAVEKTIVTVPQEWLEYTNSLLKKYFSHCDRFLVICGGNDRTGSLLLAAEKAAELDGSDEAILVTHDAARPMISPQLILQTVQAARECGGATAAIPAVDTIAVSADGRTIDHTPDRATLWQIQTPQTFRLALLRKTAASLTEAERAVLTDACGIFAARGLPVRLVSGSRNNLKLTTPGDLMLAESLLSSDAPNK